MSQAAIILHRAFDDESSSSRLGNEPGSARGCLDQEMDIVCTIRSRRDTRSQCVQPLRSHMYCPSIATEEENSRTNAEELFNCNHSEPFVPPRGHATQVGFHTY